MLAPQDLAAWDRCAFDEAIDVVALPSWDLGLGDLETIAAAVRAEIDRGADVVVVAHGTDTLEESAWLTELTLGSQRRAASAVVFTGAMRFADHPGSDGPANLADALRAGAEAAGRGLGVQVAFAGRRHAARWATKIDASALNAFDSGGRPASAPPPPPGMPVLDPHVALLKVGPVARPVVPPALHGLVLQGTGSGHVPSAYNDRIDHLLNEGVPVVLATRCRDVERSGGLSEAVLRAADLSAEKAVVALMVALGQGRDLATVRNWWDTLLAGGVR